MSSSKDPPGKGGDNPSDAPPELQDETNNSESNNDDEASESGWSSTSESLSYIEDDHSDHQVSFSDRVQEYDQDGASSSERIGGSTFSLQKDDEKSETTEVQESMSRGDLECDDIEDDEDDLRLKFKRSNTSMWRVLGGVGIATAAAAAIITRNVSTKNGFDEDDVVGAFGWQTKDGAAHGAAEGVTQGAAMMPPGPVPGADAGAVNAMQ